MTDSTTLYPVFAEELLPGGGHRSFILKRGELLRLTDLRDSAMSKTWWRLPRIVFLQKETCCLKRSPKRLREPVMLSSLLINNAVHEPQFLAFGRVDNHFVALFLLQQRPRHR